MDAIQFRFAWSVLLTQLTKSLVLSRQFGMILLGHASTSKDDVQSISGPSNPKIPLIKEEPSTEFLYSQSSHHVPGFSEFSNIAIEQEGTQLSHPRDITRWRTFDSDLLGKSFSLNWQSHWY
jgi:hypothetical protein